MEVLCVDELSGKELPHEVEEGGTAAALLRAVCRLFGRDERDAALVVDGAVVCGAGDGEDVAVGSLGLHAACGIVLRCSRRRALDIVRQWEEEDTHYSYAATPRDGLPEWAWDDETVALALVGIVKKRPSVMLHVSDRLKADRELAMAVVKEDGCLLRLLPSALRCDKTLVLAAVRGDGNALIFASHDLRDDEEVVRAAIAQNDRSISHASAYWRSALACWILPE